VPDAWVRVVELNAELEGVAELAERRTRSDLRAVKEVRGNPPMAAWFSRTKWGFSPR
jgi:hypothetical protein|tara:strand:- start:262 stop:432 length:171 start_codon:yes stop_codon:yes gene_type:complete